MSKRQYKNVVILPTEIFEKKKIVGKNKFYNERKQVKKSRMYIKQSNVTINFIRMYYLFYKTFSKMSHLTETTYL
jgi:hypothetical protein